MKNFFYLKPEGQRQIGPVLLWFLILNITLPLEIAAMVFRPERLFGRGFFFR
jgi:hypothetical protein